MRARALIFWIVTSSLVDIEERNDIVEGQYPSWKSRMKPHTRDAIVYAICSLAVVVGTYFLAAKVMDSSSFVPPNTQEEFDHFVSLHQDAYSGLIIAAIGATAAIYYRFAKDKPLWEIRAARRLEPKRSAVVIALGVFIAIMGFGSAVILVHQTYAIPTGSPDYGVSFESWNEQASLRSVAGFVGTAIFSFGILFSREPDLELAADESFFYNRPLWQCLLVIAAGVGIAAVFFGYASVEYAAYHRADNDWMLLLILFGGLLVAFCVFLVGLNMLARRPISIPYRGQLHPIQTKSEKRQ